MDDLKSLTDSELTSMGRAVRHEIDRRAALKDAQEQALKTWKSFEEQVEKLASVEGVPANKVYVRYLPGELVDWIVLGGGEKYARKIGDWIAPTTSDTEYMVGNRVRYGGGTYESLVDHNIYSPDAYPQGWKKVD